MIDIDFVHASHRILHFKIVFITAPDAVLFLFSLLPLGERKTAACVELRVTGVDQEERKTLSPGMKRIKNHL